MNMARLVLSHEGKLPDIVGDFPSWVKIDQSFARNIATDSNDVAIVQTIIAMSEALGLDVIAEGIETEGQREFLEMRGCHAFQDFLFGMPMTVKQLKACCKIRVIH